MSIKDRLKKAKEAQQKAQETTEIQGESDKAPTGGSYILDSGIYPFEIKAAYLDVKKSGATYVNLMVKNLDNDNEYRLKPLMVLSSDEKGNKTTYQTKSGGVAFHSDYNRMAAIFRLTTGEDFADEMDNVDDQEVKLYNFEQKKEVETEVEAYVQLKGETFYGGVVRTIEDINEQDPQTKQWKASGYTREVMVLDRVFHDDSMMTMGEADILQTKGEEFVEKPLYFERDWLVRNDGKTRDRSEAKEGHKPKPRGNTAPGASSGDAPKGNTGTPRAKKMLFPKKK